MWATIKQTTWTERKGTGTSTMHLQQSWKYRENKVYKLCILCFLNTSKLFFLFFYLSQCTFFLSMWFNLLFPTLNWYTLFLSLYLYALSIHPQHFDP